jgi:asparagine synthase (glutamine-hydrolysing)
MGIERIAYAEAEGGFVFGTSARTVAEFPGIGRKLRDQALYDFLFMHMVPAPATVYAGVQKLPPATVLSYSDGRYRVGRYWNPSYDYVRDFSSLRTSLRESLDIAVSASGIGSTTGAFLSGGLDSSTVAGTLAKRIQEPAKTFSVGFGEAAYDELEYARIASARFGCEAHEYQVTPADIVDALPRIAASYDEPFGNSSAVPTYLCAKLAADNGVVHLLAGDGGDELFGGNERYAKQQVFDFYRRVPNWFRQAIVEPMTRPVTSDQGPLPLRKLKSYVDQASVPLPDRFETWNFVYREGQSKLLDREFAASIDMEGPLGLMRDVWSSAPSADILERMLWFDWHFTLAYNDLRKVGSMCALAGVRVSYPMLHPAVVQVSLRVPSNMKIRHLELRSFYKRAMKGFLPGEILGKKKHGFGLPFGIWLKSDRILADLIFSLLSDLKKRHIVSPEFLTNLVDEHRTGHASYYGYVIWDLAMLEAWLAHSGTR